MDFGTAPERYWRIMHTSSDWDTGNGRDWLGNKASGSNPMRQLRFGEKNVNDDDRSGDLRSIRDNLRACPFDGGEKVPRKPVDSGT
jgi:hypothetical protein